MSDSAINANKGQSKHFLLLSKHNESFERNGLLEKNILDQLLYVWMFEVDAVNDPLLEECGGLNTMHLLGILVCRALYKDFCSKEEKIKNARSQLAIHDYLPDSEQVVHVVHVYEKPLHLYTFREFFDTLQAIQLHFQEILDGERTSMVQIVLGEFMILFGMFANYAMTEDVFDDKSNVTMIPSDSLTEVFYILTCKTLRTIVNMLLVMRRAAHIHLSAEKLESVAHEHVENVKNMIQTFHLEASLDHFNVLQQVFFLKCGQRLVYRHNFMGMFNDISQVVYFHYPDYVRSPQCTLSELGDLAMNSVAPIHLVVPELKLYFDDEDNFPCKNTEEWMLIGSVGKIYLWDPVKKTFFKSSGTGIFDLVAHYLISIKGEKFFQVVEEEEEKKENLHLGVGGKAKLCDHGHAVIIK